MRQLATMNITETVPTFNHTSPLIIGLSANHILISSNQTEIDLRCSHFWYVTKQPVIPPDIMLVKLIAYRILLPAIAIFGLTGNIINLVVLRSLKGRTFFYLFWLAVSDLSTMVLDNVVVLRLNSPPQSYVDAFIFCHILPWLTGSFLTTSAFIVVVLTIERFRAVWDPIKSQSSSRSERPWYFVLVCFLLPIVILSPSSYARQLETIASGDGTIACHVCNWSAFQRSNWGQLYIVLREVLARVIPIVVVVSLNAAIVIALSRHQRARESLHCSIDRRQREQDSREDHLKTCLATVMVFFVIGMTPVVIKNLFPKVFYSNRMSTEIFRAVAVLLLQLNTACNFYVYCFCSQAIRQRLVDLCREALPCRKRNIDLITDKSPNESAASRATTASRSSICSLRSRATDISKI